MMICCMYVKDEMAESEWVRCVFSEDTLHVECLVGLSNTNPVGQV
jgi:hypothetical protein